MIAIISSCGFNHSSVMFALKRLNAKSVITDDVDLIQAASHVILAGAGSARHAMDTLASKDLTDVIAQLSQPVLGICLGMQLLYEFSEESQSSCLGIIPGKVTAIARQKELTIPHMGWNQLKLVQAEHPLLNGVCDNDYAYFVHSYQAPVNSYTLATAEYGQTFAAVVQKNNFYATQFHPERSAKLGAKLINNFLNLS